MLNAALAALRTAGASRRRRFARRRFTPPALCAGAHCARTCACVLNGAAAETAAERVWHDLLLHDVRDAARLASRRRRGSRWATFAPPHTRAARAAAISSRISSPAASRSRTSLSVHLLNDCTAPDFLKSAPLLRAGEGVSWR
jgi:hypothetical protein